jgi:hypothetical protein
MLPNTPQAVTDPFMQVAPQETESPAIAFFELVNGSGNATLHFTIRAMPGETPDAMFIRTVEFIKWVDPTADLAFKFKDAPRGYGGGKGGAGGKRAPSITGGEFVVTAVARIERPAKPGADGQPKPNWSYLRCFGIQDGQEIYADCFFGNAGWAKPQNAVTESNLFPNFMTWPVDTKKPTPNNFVWVAKVTENTQFHTFDVTAIESR